MDDFGGEDSARNLEQGLTNMREKQVLSQLWWLGGVVIVTMLACPICVKAEVSEQVVVEAATRFLVKDGVLPPEWTFQVDKDLQRWRHVKAQWQKSLANERKLGREDAELESWLARMESVMAGKQVWAVVYKLTLPPGEQAFHHNATVFVDADSGRVLAIIEPEGSVKFTE